MVQHQDLERFANTRVRGKGVRLLAIKKLTRLAQLDIGRELRKGLPEIILAEGKSPSDVAMIAEAMVQRTGRAIVSRAGNTHLRAVRRRGIHGSKIQFF